jgi:preprotein translocase SecE subunit
MHSFFTYFSDSLQELHQVRWPTQQQAIRLTTIVIVFLIVSSAALGAVDALIGQFIQYTIRTF